VDPYRRGYNPSSQYTYIPILKWKSPKAVEIKGPLLVQYFLTEKYTGFVKVKKAYAQYVITFLSLLKLTLHTTLILSSRNPEAVITTTVVQ
jgi:hypothetical protein